MSPNFSSIFRALLNYFRSWPVLTLVAWAILYVPRIFSLGFYYGDSWASIVAIAHGNYHTYGSLYNLLVSFSAKPVAIITHLLLILIAGDSTTFWHLLMALVCLLGAVSLYLFIKRLDRSRAGKYGLTADLVAALWLSAPISLGATALPNMLNALIGQVFFFLCGVKLLELAHDQDLSFKKLAIALLLLLGSYWSYEVYYFQYLALLGIIYLYSHPRVTLKRVVILGFFTSALQLFCIVYNRLIGYLGSYSVGSKTFNSAWRDLLNVEAIALTFSHNLRIALGSYFQQIFISVCVMAGAAVIAIIVKVIIKRELKFAWDTTLAILLLVLCYLLAVTVCALAGYGMAYLGVESRIAMAPVFLYGLVAFVLLTASRNWKPASIVAHGAALVLLCNLGSLERKLVAHWRESWDIQRSVLEQLSSHEEALKQLTPDSIVVFIGPYYVGTAPVFQADIALSVAVKEQYKQLQSYLGVTPYFLSVYNEHNVSLRDGVLVQATSSGSEQRRKASDVWVWNYFENNFRRMENGETFEPAKLGTFIHRVW